VTFEVPVALVAFNRPEHASKVIASLRVVRPTRVLAVLDGPRAGNEQDKDKCRSVRRVIDDIDWPCDVSVNASSENLGCRNRFITGLDWVFSETDRAVILEDDCVPLPRFFSFAQQMLARFSDDQRVFGITGTNVAGSWRQDEQDYHFSMYGSIWGWATWRRAWLHYADATILWQDRRARRAIRDVLHSRVEAWKRVLVSDYACRPNCTTWDYQWTLARLLNSGMMVVPSVNLVTNIGDDGSGTHRPAVTAPTMNPKPERLRAPLLENDEVRDNPFVVPDSAYDRLVFRRHTRLQFSGLCRVFGYFARRIMGNR
jgi:hypothetical protein